MITRKIITLLAAVLIGVSFVRGACADSSVGAGYTGKFENRKQVCMLQDTLQPKEGLEHVYNGKKYYLCCAGCLMGFDANPAHFSHANDPVNGKSVDKADAPMYAYSGRAYFFSSQETLDAFSKNPEKYLRGAKH